MDAPRRDIPDSELDPQAVPRGDAQASHNEPPNPYVPPQQYVPQQRMTPQPGAPYGQPWPQPGYAQAYGVAGQVVTEGVLLIPAGFGPRFGAFLIDMLLLSITGQIFVLITGIPQPGAEAGMRELLRFMNTMDFAALDALSDAVAPPWYEAVLLYGLYAAYFTLFHGLAGATLGKMALGLSVRRQDGRPLDLGYAFLRYALYFLAAKLIYTAWWMFADPEKRTLYDVFLKTNVFRTARPVQ
jgi:uncharacterized RDD family membrane protein YckC